MTNEEYRQYIIEMLYQIDMEVNNQFLKQIFTIVRHRLIKKESEILNFNDRYRSKVFRIINRLDHKAIKEIYYFLVGYTGENL